MEPETLNMLRALTEETLHAVKRDDGSLDYVREPSLLTQLHEAKTLRLNSTGGSSGGATIPFGCAPLGLEQDIARICYNTVKDDVRQQLAGKDLTARVNVWAYACEPATVKDYLTVWCETIRDFYRTKYPITGACPQADCGAETLHDLSFGESKRRPALMLTVEIPRVTCGVCGSTWQGIDAIEELALGLEDDMIVSDQV